jgi:prophage DNA circulation protein
MDTVIEETAFRGVFYSILRYQDTGQRSKAGREKGFRRAVSIFFYKDVS